MTAQTVIMNKLCVGLSSDSSVTLVGPDGPQRTFPTAEKVTPLPAPHSVAVLHSGSTELLGIPYSVLLVEWMRTLPEQPLDTVAAYREHLVSWIAGQQRLFPSEAQDEYLGWIIRDFFLAVRRNILKSCDEQEISQEQWGSAEASTIIDTAIAKGQELLDGRPKLTGWEEVDCGALLEEHADLLKETREWVFDDTPRTAQGDTALTDLAASLLSVFETYERDADLVLVGFGADEVFPAADQTTFQGIIDGRLRIGPSDVTLISRDMDSTIIPIGQTEAVHTFLRAYNNAFLRTAHTRLEKLMAEVKESIGPDGELAEKLDSLESSAHEGLEEDFGQVSWSEFVQPMVKTVAALPPAEVTRMAESLVGLQVLRQLTQADAETVGGPIDVALITRQDGFRWVRHKSLTLG